MDYWPQETPFLLLDVDRLQDNIRDMSNFALKNGLKLRPHSKTHKIPEIAYRQLEAGAVGITVAKLAEAEVMAEAGIADIFIANEIVSPVKIERLLKLAEKVRLCVGVDSRQGAELLQRQAEKCSARLEVMLELDTGLRRAGVLPGHQALELAAVIRRQPNLYLKGIFTHAGQAYAAKDSAEVAEIGLQEGKLMVETAKLLRADGIDVETVSVGSTPTVEYSGKVRGVTEIRPGNYVFYDAMQVSLGAARQEQCALKVIATVISRPSADRAVIDAGSKALALDRGAHGNDLLQGFGMLPGMPAVVVERLSEEHGVLTWREGTKAPAIGSQLQIIPNHACTVVNLFDRVFVESKGKITGTWAIKARGKMS